MSRIETISAAEQSHSRGLREQERPALAHESSRERFEAAIAPVFAQPAQTLYGGESLDAACARFTRAIAEVTTPAVAGPLLLVTHGTVLSAYVGRATDIDAFSLWRGLELPSFVALDVGRRAISHSWRAGLR